MTETESDSASTGMSGAAWPLQSTGTRLQRLRESIAVANLDAILLTDMVNVGYVTGFTGSSAYALIGQQTALLVTDSRYTLRARAETTGFDIVIVAPGAGYSASIKETLDSYSTVRRIGVEGARVTVAFWEKMRRDITGVEWVAIEDIVEGLRAVKDSREVGVIRDAIGIAEGAFLKVKPLLRPGISERDFAANLDYQMRLSGADVAAFETIVASGPYSAQPHHRPGGRVLQAGDWVTVDWGAFVDGYNSDITRTFLLGPVEVTPEHVRVYETVREAQQRAIAAIAPGKTGQAVDAVARDYIALAGYGDYFGHSLGHALGRTVHDGPGFSTRTTEFILKAGMVLTVEPGIYIENWGGIRIEEDIVITETGCEVLTHLPTRLEVIG